MDKSKAKKALMALADEKELEALKKLDMEILDMKLEEMKKSLKEVSESKDSKLTLQAVAETYRLIEKTRNNLKKMNEQISDSYNELVKALIGKLDEVKTAVSVPETVPLYRAMIEGIAKVKKSIDDKPVPVWKYPQYSSVSVRDTNFRNINPSIAAFGITQEYDYISLTYSGSNISTVTYKKGGASGTTVATLALAYSGNNITSVTRS